MSNRPLDCFNYPVVQSHPHSPNGVATQQARPAPRSAQIETDGAQQLHKCFEGGFGNLTVFIRQTKLVRCQLKAPIIDEQTNSAVVSQDIKTELLILKHFTDSV